MEVKSFPSSAEIWPLLNPSFYPSVFVAIEKKTNGDENVGKAH